MSNLANAAVPEHFRYDDALFSKRKSGFSVFGVVRGPSLVVWLSDHQVEIEDDKPFSAAK